MAFSTINSAWLDIGDPTKKELFDLIKSNQDDLDDRVTDLEATIAVESPIIFQVTGPYWLESSPITDAAHLIRVPFNIDLTSARLQIIDDGSAGTLDCDVKYSDDDGSSFSTIFSARPSIANGGGNYGDTTGTLSVTEIDAGDLLRLDIITSMTGNERFILILTWETRA